MGVTYAYAAPGVYNVTFIASDGALADTEIVVITVNEITLPPVLDPIGPQAVDEGQNLNFGISASDPGLTIPALYAEFRPLLEKDAARGKYRFITDPDSMDYSVTQLDQKKMRKRKKAS